MVRTEHSRRKIIARRLLGARGYGRLRVWKAIWQFKLGQPYELPTAVLAQLVTSGDVAFDIGANIGQYACRLSSLVGRSGRVYSVEPLADNFRLLQQLVRRLRLQNVELVHCAVSDTAGEAEMRIPILGRSLELATQATIEPEPQEADASSARRERVRVVPLDALARDLGISRLDVMKCDAEGHDARVVAGAMETLERYKPLLLLEASPTTILEPLSQIGYNAIIWRSGKFERWVSGTESQSIGVHVYAHAESERIALDR